MSDEIPINLHPSVETLTGKNPVVLIGPNGAGKSRLGVRIAAANEAVRISAVRTIVLPENLPMRPLRQAREQLTSQLQSAATQSWQVSNEINELFSKLMAEDAASAVRYRNDSIIDDSAIPEHTSLMQLTEVWQELYPGRQIDFAGYQPLVTSDNSETGPYSAAHMSDGERVALYLAGRVLDADKPIIIVDEPEVHFHSLLAGTFWDRMEDLRPDCRFVYITHDLSFALSRPDATFVIIMPDQAPQLVSLVDGLPTGVAAALLAGASFSISADRIVFCEGTSTSIDKALYSAWFISQKTAVVPVGPCTDVVQTTLAFAQSTLVAGVTAEGIIDRDYWPNEYIDSMQSNIKILEVHEVENLLCLRGVLTAVAEHQGKSTEEATLLYKKFLADSKSQFQGNLLNKQISERYRRRCSNQFDLALNRMKVSDDLGLTETDHVTSLDPSLWGTEPADLFIQEKSTMQGALSGKEEEFLRYFPGKVFLHLAASSIGLGRKAYVELVCKSLAAKDGDILHPLGVKLEAALMSFLPSRSNP